MAGSLERRVQIPLPQMPKGPNNTRDSICLRSTPERRAYWPHPLHLLVRQALDSLNGGVKQGTGVIPDLASQQSV